MARRAVARRARARVALGLLAFLVIASGVIARRSAGVARAKQLLELDRRRESLESERAKLVSDIRSASGLGQLMPMVGPKLGMRVPSDSQVVRLPRPSVPRGG